jgi:hypothetical protein
VKRIWLLKSKPTAIAKKIRDLFAHTEQLYECCCCPNIQLDHLKFHFLDSGLIFSKYQNSSINTSMQVIQTASGGSLKNAPHFQQRASST